MIELRVWDFNNDDRYIPSFLVGMSLAHKEDIRTEEWFHWKFEQSPYGRAILACAFDGDTVAGCVAYGKGLVRYHDKEWSAALSYETFVNPHYQGHGLFKKLITLAEGAMKEEKIQFLYNFPNSNSITGFKHMGWNCNNDIRCFKIKVNNVIKLATHVGDLKKVFLPNPSNLDDLRSSFSDCNIPEEITDDSIITPIWTTEYIKWRFFTYPNREYYVINDDRCFAITMIGYRGKLKSAHILYFISKSSCRRCDIAKYVIKKIKKDVNPDLLEFGSTTFDNALSSLWGFFKVPSHGNFCYKIFDEEMRVKDFKIVLPSINAHTY